MTGRSHKPPRAGATPVSATSVRVRVAQTAEAPGSNPGSCGFESRGVHRGIDAQQAPQDVAVHRCDGRSNPLKHSP